MGKIAGVLGIAASAVGLLAAPGVATAAPSGVPGCASECHRVFVQHLSHGGTIEGVRGKDEQGLPASFAVYRVDGALRGAIPLSTPDAGDGSIEYLEKGRCFAAGPDDHCLFLGAAGAHAEGAVLAHVSRDTGFVLSSARAGTPSAAIVDLDKDGTPDVVLRESTYEPDYATAPQYWMTYRTAGDKLKLTGCSALSTKPGHVPTSLLTGKCGS